jgi:hypothetical protein
MSDTFHICFNTDEMPGKVVAVEVVLRNKIVDSGPSPLPVFNVGLKDHPLYRDLFDYCLHNPPHGVAVKRRGD